jgi:hypothetical protein
MPRDRGPEAVRDMGQEVEQMPNFLGSQPSVIKHLSSVAAFAFGIKSNCRLTTQFCFRSGGKEDS